MSFVLYDLPLGIIVLTLMVFLWILFGRRPDELARYSRGQRILIGVPIVWRRIVATEDQSAILNHHRKLMLLDFLVLLRLTLAILLYLSSSVHAL